MLLSGSGVITNEFSVFGIIMNILLFGGSYWFLYVLFGMTIVVGIIDYYVSNSPKLNNYRTHILSTLLLMGLIIYMANFNIELLKIGQLLRFFPFFICGMILKQYDFISERKITISGVISFIILSLFYVVCACVFSDVFVENRCFSWILALAGIILVYQLSLFLNKVKILQYCGMTSLQLYLLNGSVLLIMRTIICSILHISNSVTILVLLFVSTFGSALVLYRLILGKIQIVKVLMGA